MIRLLGQPALKPGNIDFSGAENKNWKFYEAVNYSGLVNGFLLKS